VTYGNVPLQSCLRNVVALFHVLEKEMAWRKATGTASEAYGALKAFKPIVAVGADHPLEDELLMADYFHGEDGLHGVHEAHPDLAPADAWHSLFRDVVSESAEPPSFSSFFTPSKTVAHKEILRVLREEPADTITIVAIGPLTNVALAAAEDPETFLRVRELVVMGGAVGVAGNITPVAEFNCYADAVAAARVFALTSPTPASTLPLIPQHRAALPSYPALSRQLKLTLFPLDITTPHLLNKGYFMEKIKPCVESGSPLARWCNSFLMGTFNKIDSLVGGGSEPGLSLHDPMCIWYMILRDDPAWKAAATPEDIRIETSGQWTRGMHVLDRRIRSKLGETKDSNITTHPGDPTDKFRFGDVPGETMGWLSASKGNRINRIIGSPGEDAFAGYLMKSLFDR